MWNTTLAINTAICSVLTVFFFYSIGALILQGAWRQFLFALVFWLFSIASEIIIAALDS